MMKRQHNPRVSCRILAIPKNYGAYEPSLMMANQFSLVNMGKGKGTSQSSFHMGEFDGTSHFSGAPLENNHIRSTL
ncbi:hypothetical protein HanXRQr2_Chr15g0700361 [Helianthus annuus]|uniref:Uncharacterized protein n=1 Tax=Helianthus annuus TaxID=4232 RepID=A0A9K3E140_HELAN|nr:hypothetical protein HanXRQr2_Chr15g0700361 [Helianthus annuus]KAJ0451719.1 hypothetical protein HanHA300_Chr15g0570781 [Helianthus annuus]KAJ0473604.1 hypothetical protein HanHA89_Chr15g0620241 [Helianthus annuus]KAJ0649182.1 hypothetical protein HanLR1_Chr15g0581351 [Helianthus annuus]KAJ0831859.1 hypothetical protein HanPSC8_Chr15g0672021 [Helianthus annuus]